MSTGLAAPKIFAAGTDVEGAAGAADSDFSSLTFNGSIGLVRG